MTNAELTPVNRIKSLIETDGIKKRFTDVLGKRAPSFLSSIVSAYTMNESLSKCDPMSVISSAMIAATLDLPINPSLGMAHIVPYKGVGTFQMGWKGFVQLALRSREYQTINATVIYEGQLESHNSFTGDMKFREEKTSDAIVGYLLYFRLLNGFEKYFYWTKEQCLAHAKRYSASYKIGKGRWVEDFDAMGLKTVVKLGLAKYGILSIDMQKAIEKDEASGSEYPDATQSEIVPETDSEPKSPNRLKEILGAIVVDESAIEFPEKK